jgi:VanZ family protein
MWLIVVVPLAVLSLRGSRWAYGGFVLFAIAFLPARAGFEIQSLVCETPVSVASGLYSLQNWKHILLCTVVSLMTLAQFRERSPRAFVVAILATVSLGFVAELEQGFLRDGHCRMRDLVPDAAGAMLGASLGLVWSRRQANNQMQRTSAAQALNARR